MPAHGIVFHHLHRDGERFGQGSITAEQFADIIEFTGIENILPAQDWYERAISNRLRENDVCITFDDNLRCQYDIAAPVLEHYGLTGFFFIYSSVSEGNIENLEIYRRFRSEYFDHIEEFYRQFEQLLAGDDIHAKLAGFRHEEYLKPYAFQSPADKRFRFIRDEILGPQRYFTVMDAMIAKHGLDKLTLAKGLWMDNACLKALTDKGHVVGLHSYSHPTRMSCLPGAEQESEYRRNSEHIAKATGARPVTMSHPCNSYTAETLEILRKLGIRLGFRSNMESIADAGPLEYPRIDHVCVMQKMAA